MLLRQFAKSPHGVPDPIQSLYKNCVDRNRGPSQSEVSTTLGSVLDKFTMTYVIVDALDECEDVARAELLRVLPLIKSRALEHGTDTQESEAAKSSESFSWYRQKHIDKS
jgi:hypothetical protein